MPKRLPLAALFLAAACALPCSASEWDYRPFAPNHAPAFLWFLHPVHQPASTLDKGEWEFSPAFHYSSHYVGVDAPPYQLFQHGEIASLYLAGRWGVAERLTLDAEIPFHSLHKNRLRGLVHRKQLTGTHYWFDADNERVFEGGTGLTAGDATLGATVLLAQGGGTAPRLAFRAAAQFPVGDETQGFGNGRMDYAAVLAAKWLAARNPRKGIEARVFGASPGGLSRAPDFPTHVYYGASASFHAPMFPPFGERWTFGGILFWNTSPVNASVVIPTLRGRSFGLAGSLFYDVSPRAQMEIMFMEDFSDGAPAVHDFALAVGMRFRGGRPR